MKNNLNERTRTTLLGHWWNNWRLTKGVVRRTEFYIEDCQAFIAGSSLCVEVAAGHVIIENYDHEPTFKDIEVLRTKVKHLKSIDYGRFES